MQGIKPTTFFFTAFCLIHLGWNASPLLAENSGPPGWSTTGDLRTARINHTATLLRDGKALIAGGWDGSRELASVELYLPNEGVFTEGPNLHEGRTNHTATLLANGDVLVVGGQFQGRGLASAEIYHPGQGTWTNAASLHVARSYHTATLLANGQVLVTGGTRVVPPPVFPQGAPPGSALDLAELYDPGTGKWTVTDNLHTARYVHNAILLRDGKVMVTGGLGAGGGDELLASVELFDPSSRTWTTGKSLITPLVGHTSTLLANGQVLIAGGKPTIQSDTSEAELYLPASGTWKSTGSLHQERNAHTATTLPNGQILVAGGVNASGVLTGAELYDPILAQWTKTDSMNKPHSLQTAILLNGGRVLIAGGGYAAGSPAFVQASSELYTPLTENSIPPSIHDSPSLLLSKPSSSHASPLLNLAACFVILAAGMVILASSLAILLSMALAFILIRNRNR